MRKIVAALAVGCLLAGGQLARAENKSESKVVKTAESARYRGFTVANMDRQTLEDASRTWHANQVRYMVRPAFWAKHKYRGAFEDAWQKTLDALPAQLDTAKELGIAVVFELHDVTNIRESLYNGDNKKRLSEFWNNPENLELMVRMWRQVAEICKDRDQVIWFDLLNEPLNWEEMPRSPRKWPSWAQRLIDEIRTIDTRHEIVIEVGPGGLCWGFKDFPLLRGEKLIYSAHNYQPHAYAHQGIKNLANTDLAKAYDEIQKPWPGIYGDSSGGYWDKARLEQELAPVREFQLKHNVRIYIGEFSVVRWAPNGPQYLRDNLEIFERYGWDWSYHAFRESALWSLEHRNDYATTERMPEGQLTDRAQVLMEYLARNQKNNTIATKAVSTDH